jgi:hypothetical protein
MFCQLLEFHHKGCRSLEGTVSASVEDGERLVKRLGTSEGFTLPASAPSLLGHALHQ